VAALELRDLIRLTGLSADVLTKKMMLWVNHGIIALRHLPGTGQVYSLISHQEKRVRWPPTHPTTQAIP
jgi:hypothetical protein